MGEVESGNLNGKRFLTANHANSKKTEIRKAESGNPKAKADRLKSRPVK
jgi:hypothetical protein